MMVRHMCATATNNKWINFMAQMIHISSIAPYEIQNNESLFLFSSSSVAVLFTHWKKKKALIIERDLESETLFLKFSLFGLFDVCFHHLAASDFMFASMSMVKSMDSSLTGACLWCIMLSVLATFIVSFRCLMFDDRFRHDDILSIEH